MNPAKLSRDEKQLKTRLALIESGFSLISSHGYGAVSIRNISKHANYTQGAFYSNFSNKEDFLLELMRLQFEKENIQLQKIISTENSNIDHTIDGLRIWLSDFFNNFEWLKISIELQLYAARDQAFALEYQKIWQTHQDEVARILSRLIPATQLVDQKRIENITVELISLSYGLALQYMIFKDDIEKYIDIIIKSLNHSLEVLNTDIN
ncbi:TetR/AcrR family transcriptional regulator [Acinetobacter sp. C_4_1]|jgi:AcrR family transcriptional regulator|uniref:TetR/AcrR family transcriptional regulator n=1 Tax=unclassified Acinetobacter TaxID=196816 RepID=UPI0021B6F6CC|nr:MULTISPECIES: TetR/AcrR family transcriptional regulator [unclassified Acinetobacter]MCT8090100.1 TetR/AcrR family transcriptional regulator [Acinetobacter sp. F_3_1]MCT8098577.1 TetR/AcrR family transcriptional regulator [Acinetobacter sp. C_3_1]MCT8101648.1 TetR/AcrR family transcriptional regulator [Acinetobacter sp. C_4_1]MCT8134983.1 TetR/AcrR family transcriptional regulator [Acinetobacter sp. T_3_1]